ncbi:MAG: ASKHA domain-containing protein, partial [Calditrichia bacterium]
PRHLAHKPYTPAFQGPATVDAKSLGIKINPLGVVYGIPNLACFVGSDITAVLTILDLDKQDKFQLAIDMGTNGEMVIGSKDRLLCCSSPAGPAWEGACITWGMRAKRGAIERAEIENNELHIRTIGESEPIGICGSGLIDIVGEFFRAGAIDKSGRILDSVQLKTNRVSWLKSLIVNGKNGGNGLEIAKIGNNNSITISQGDIREFQLAKAAIASGVKMLIEAVKISPDKISDVYIAGAFGNHIRAKDVLDLSLIPKILPEKIKFIGNAALTGAEAILKSKEARKRAEQISQKIEYVEIADHPEFQENFANAIHFSAH